MKKLIIILTIVIVSSCALTKQEDPRQKVVRLNFSECVVVSESFELIEIKLPVGFSKERIDREGACEFRFIYGDGSVVYISSDVWVGSSLNFKNRHSIGHESYNKDGLLDTIKLSGIQHNSLYWSEKIIGDIMIGFAETTLSKKQQFEHAFNTMTKD